MIGGPSPRPITLRRLGGFDITDAAGLPDGGIVVLERRFRYSEGMKMRIRRITPAELKRNALIEGEVLLEATDVLNIDNMEAIAAHRSRSGRDDPDAHVGRQFQPAAADADHAVRHSRGKARPRGPAGPLDGPRRSACAWVTLATSRLRRRAFMDSSSSPALSR